MNYQDLITRAQFAAQEKIAKVLAAGSQILAVKDRAAAFLAADNAAVKERAGAIISKANGLVANQRQIQSDALQLGAQANVLLAQIQNDPTWKAIQNNPSFMSYAGYAVKAVANNNIGQATALAEQLAGLASRAQTHLDAVAKLERDQRDLEDFAQGKGFSAKLSSVGGFFGGVAMRQTTIFSVGAVLVGGFMAWQLLAPARAAAHAVQRNPHRRRRRR
jgi:hypothetical protein